MKEFRELKEYINNSLGELETYHQRRFGTEMLVRHETKMKSILVFTYLYDEFYDDEIPEDVYKELINDGIGLIGPGDGKLIAILHKLFGWHPYIRSHGILHDAFGQFYNRYGKGKGYMYTISASKTYYWMRKCMFLGQITGLYYCIKNKIIK